MGGMGTRHNLPRPMIEDSCRPVFFIDFLYLVFINKHNTLAFINVIFSHKNLILCIHMLCTKQ